MEKMNLKSMPVKSKKLKNNFNTSNDERIFDKIILEL